MAGSLARPAAIPISFFMSAPPLTPPPDGADDLLRARLPELLELEALIRLGGPRLRSRLETQVRAGGRTLPVYALELGSARAEAPTVGLFAGVHGVERIGTHVVLAFLHSLLVRLEWDPLLQAQLERIRLVLMPLINPGGMLLRRRCNPNGVDLMRNAPVESRERMLPLVCGQRLSRRLPWYRGDGGSMEPEARAVCRVVMERLLPAPFSLSLDCHSGFGMQDRVWFPYAHSRRPFAHRAEALALQRLFQAAYPHHRYYTFEPQSNHYTTHGDLWDLLHGQAGPERVFLPLTLEMGSWLWVKKNPLQLFKYLGLFNPLPPHRHQRVLRRHLPLLEFLLRAAQAHASWLPTGERREEMQAAALDTWYRKDQSA